MSSREASELQRIKENLIYLFTKVNWGASAMDAKAISILNSVTSDIARLIEEDD